MCVYLHKKTFLEHCDFPVVISFSSLIFLNQVQLIYNVVLISVVQQSDSVIHMHSFCYFFSITVYHRILNVVPCAIP